MASDSKYNIVEEHYSSLAKKLTSEDKSIDSSQDIASAFGYTLEELKSIPSEANLGVSCGNPIQIANLKEGETVIDLGSGAGLDVFLASKKVGPKGKVFGVDMSKEMIKVATTNQNRYHYNNVEFIESRIDNIPLHDNTVDLVISNCVLNLVPHDDKPKVFKEIYRLLKPGGRISISDILSIKELPEKIRNNIGLYVGCVSGARSVNDYSSWLKDAGFENVLIFNTENDLNVYKNEQFIAEGLQKSCCLAGRHQGCVSTNTIDDFNDIKNINFNEYVAAYKIYAVKKKQ